MRKIPRHLESRALVEECGMANALAKYVTWTRRVLALALLFSAHRLAAAELAASPQGSASRPPASLRAVVSAGGSDLGLAGYLGVEGEAWLTSSFALGGRIARGEQLKFAILGPAHTRDLTLVEIDLLAGLRSALGVLVAGVGV